MVSDDITYRLDGRPENVVCGNLVVLNLHSVSLLNMKNY